MKMMLKIFRKEIFLFLFVLACLLAFCSCSDVNYIRSGGRVKSFVFEDYGMRAVVGNNGFEPSTYKVKIKNGLVVKKYKFIEE